MEALESSILGARSYPCNLVRPDTSAFVLDRVRRELQRDSGRIFCDESNASVDMLEISNDGLLSNSAVKHYTVHNQDELRKALESPKYRGTKEPMCRMMYGALFIDKAHC